MLVYILGILVVQMPQKGKKQKAYKEVSFPLIFFYVFAIDFDRYSQANPP